MVDNSNMPHPKCLGSQKNPGTEPKTCEKGPKLGFEYLPTSKTLHCVRTACMAFPKNDHSLQMERPCVMSPCAISLIGDMAGGGTKHDAKPHEQSTAKFSNGMLHCTAPKPSETVRRQN